VSGAAVVESSRKRKNLTQCEASADPSTAGGGGAGLAAAFDNVLEASLLADLRYAFREDSLFWVVRICLLTQVLKKSTDVYGLDIDPHTSFRICWPFS